MSGEAVLLPGVGFCVPMGPSMTVQMRRAQIKSDPILALSCLLMLGAACAAGTVMPGDPHGGGGQGGVGGSGGSGGKGGGSAGAAGGSGGASSWKDRYPDLPAANAA